MSRNRQTRRSFLQGSAGLAAAGALAPYFFTATGTAADDQPKSKNDRHRIGCIGNGGMGNGDARAAANYGDIVAVCDVDRKHAQALSEKLTKGKAEVFEDYRKLLDRKDIDVVTISTPDHWHARIAIAALKAGKDVYCQKPLTLTIDEGKKICHVQKATGRVFQVGTQQRSENRELFLKAVALCQLGRLGKIKRVTCAIGGASQGGPFKRTTPPPELNWDVWLGQTPKVEYIRERCHGTFRWWYEYSGGKLTDWGAHHVDIAQWAIGMDQGGPVSIEPLAVKHPQELKNGMPTKDDCFNTAMTFRIQCVFPNGVEMLITDGRGGVWDGKKGTENGVLVEGEKGTIFVNRGMLIGEQADALKNDPVPEEVLTKLRKGKPTNTHMGNFMACVKDRSTPISDVFTHHRALTTCHLANIAIRLGRKLAWDPEKEQIVGDEAANAWLSRPQRKGYEIEV
jgi:predicted dehydrogenase